MQHSQTEEAIMPSTVNVLICILALLTGVLIGERYRKWKHRDDDKKT